MATAQGLKATHTVCDRVTSVDDKVKAVDNKVTMVIDGTRRLRTVIKRACLTLLYLEGKQARVVMDQVKRSSSPLALTGFGGRAQPSSQGTNYDRTFSDGSPRLIRLLTTTLRVVPTTRERPNGFSKAVSSRDGNPLAHSCGFTEIVRFLFFIFILLIYFDHR
jgi:hypothetical protein